MLIVIATVCAVMFLHYAKDMLIPLVAALVIAACLGPATHQLRRVIPNNSLAAAVAILATLFIIGGAALLVSDDVANALERLPDVSKQLKDRASLEPATSNPVKKIAEAAQNLEEAATTMSGPATPVPATAATHPAGKPEAPVPPRPTWLRTQLLLGSTTLIQGITQLSLAFLVAYFILASGPLLQRKLLRASGNNSRQRARFRRILRQGCKQVQLYVLIVLVTNIAIGLAAWPTFYLLDIEHPGLWAIFAGVVHIVPYIGSIMLAAFAAVFHYIGSPDILQSLSVGLIILVVASLVGTLLPTWLQSRTSRMNQMAVFLGIMFWGWMWGLWGLFLGAPIVVIVKVVCDNVAALRGTARLLGD
ncbi:MAG: AI-2E family transporter [Betaproteobacteria bacterium]|nr:AI-2E family transporter [Betaproteobacteria bacterium]